MVAVAARQPPWKSTSKAAGSLPPQQQPCGAGSRIRKKMKKKSKPLPPLLAPGTAVEVLRNGAWVSGGTVTIRNDRTYMVRLAGMTVLATRGRVRPAAATAAD